MTFMNLPVAGEVATVLADVLFDVVFLKGVVFAATAILLGTALRHRSAAGRATVWSAALAGLVILFLTVVPWSWKSGIPEVWSIEIAEFPQQLYRSSLPGITLLGSEASAAAWLGLVWVVGAVFLLARFGLALGRIAQVTRGSRPVRDGRMADAIRQAGAGRPGTAVRVRLSSEVQGPVTWGLWRPVILLPVSARNWSDHLLSAVLRHEIAHVRRRDYASLIVLELARALHWPNPLVWYLVRQARRDQERACDDAALDQGIPPAEYARYLVTVARNALPAPTPHAALPMVRRSVLWDRVRGVMRADADRRPASPRTVATVVLLMAVTLVQVSLSDLWACPTDDSPARPTPTVLTHI